MKKYKIGVSILLAFTMFSLIFICCGGTSEATSASSNNTKRRVVDICLGYDSAAALFSDGTAKKIKHGYYEEISSNKNWSGLVDIECGWTYDKFYGLRSDGTVVFGNNSLNDSDKWTDIIKIEMGNYSDSPLVGLKKDGTVVTNKDYDFEEVNEWSDVKDISVCSSIIAAITNSGQVMVATKSGKDDHGACNVDDWDDLDIVQVSAGGGYTAALLEDGTVITTELIGSGLVAENYIDEVEDWTDITQICAGITQIAGITSDGRVVVAHTEEYNYDVSYWRDVVKLISGEDVLIGIRKDGKFYYAGDEERY